MTTLHTAAQQALEALENSIDVRSTPQPLAVPAQSPAEGDALLRMLANRARTFPNYPLGYHIPEVFAALGEEPPKPDVQPKYTAEAVAHWQLERMRHIANEWADMATNGPQYLRNVRDGICTIDEALAGLAKDYEHCRKVNDAPGLYGSADIPAPAPAPESSGAKLALCPFCGRRPVLTVRPDNAEATSYFATVACFCDGYAACAHKDATASEADEAERLVREKWNRRTTASPAVRERVAGGLTPHPIADIICAWANGFRVEFRYRHHNPGIPEEIYLSDERWHLCGKAYSAWSGINEHRIHADDLAAWEAFKRAAAEEDHDAWQCDRCHGDGWHWVEREGVEWRDKVSTKEHCEQCDGLGWLGPDATKAAASKKVHPPVQGSQP